MLTFHPVYEEISPKIENDDYLIRLFRTALYAIKEEDGSLSRAVSQAPPDFQSFYNQGDHGLGYWAFESQIIHSIYKSWLAFVPVAWEKRNPQQPNQIDLVVYKPCDRTGPEQWEPSLICEAKWWMDNNTATRVALKTDFKMMERWKTDVEKRVLIGLWYWDAAALSSESYASIALREEIANQLKTGVIEMLYMGAFPTDFTTMESPDKDGYFCMGFFHLRK
ncbi:hypothetical protein KKF84_08925 [Myxococcota bacterium]|nr:hypothetical protein [Myxococcota bacterium]MBU1535432.1 hypothetical protein [Myxococcota bacterium]